MPRLSGGPVYASATAALPRCFRAATSRLGFKFAAGGSRSASGWPLSLCYCATFLRSRRLQCRSTAAGALLSRGDCGSGQAWPPAAPAADSSQSVRLPRPAARGKTQMRASCTDSTIQAEWEEGTVLVFFPSDPIKTESADPPSVSLTSTVDHGPSEIRVESLIKICPELRPVAGVVPKFTRSNIRWFLIAEADNLI